MSFLFGDFGRQIARYLHARRDFTHDGLFPSLLHIFSDLAASNGAANPLSRQPPLCSRWILIQGVLPAVRFPVAAA
jgi:hypothetical protein